MVLFDDYVVTHYIQNKVLDIIPNIHFSTRRAMAWAILRRKTNLIHITHYPQYELDSHTRVSLSHSRRVKFTFALNPPEFLISVYREQ